MFEEKIGTRLGDCYFQRIADEREHTASLATQAFCQERHHFMVGNFEVFYQAPLKFMNC